MMNVKDARKVIDDLRNKPFLCSDEAIETDSGYVITRKEVKINENGKCTSFEKGFVKEE